MPQPRKEYGLKIASFDAWSEYFSSGLRGFVREYITSVEACSSTKSILQTNPGSVSNNIKSSKQFCSEANWKKENLVSTIYKVKQEINGGSVSNPLTPRMNYVKEGMQAEPRDEEDLNVREGDVINLPNLLFTENRDYLVKYNDDQKVKAAQLVGKAILLYFVPVCIELCYPFTDERISDLKSEDDEAAKQPSLETLLASPVRNYVISNKEDKVPIHTLKDKVRRIEILPNFYPLLELMVPSLKSMKITLPEVRKMDQKETIRSRSLKQYVMHFNWVARKGGAEI
ncbi:hypothetical protein POM88_047960 [Heracleum sosnowskyi]|uniref:Uncharacterized protein n=1 Tax=Heracleum sosnowskyi TaxID=360622 RepID=A0AAD8GUV7_9APIA|nr:hypothetical protein POM88_047960 [Heracleum sosnowskyi]